MRTSISTPWKLQQRCFSSTLPPRWIFSLFFLKGENESSAEFFFISQLHVSGSGGLACLWGQPWCLFFFLRKTALDPPPKKCPWDLIIFLYYFSLQRHLLFYCVALLKKKSLVDALFFFPNGKGSMTSKMDCMPFLSLTKGAERFEWFQGDMKVCGQDGYGK